MHFIFIKEYTEDPKKLEFGIFLNGKNGFLFGF
jgi:hypothetical protein